MDWNFRCLKFLLRKPSRLQLQIVRLPKARTSKLPNFGSYVSAESQKKVPGEIKTK